MKDPGHKPIEPVNYKILSDFHRAMRDPAFRAHLAAALPADHQTAFDPSQLLALLNGPLGALLFSLIAQWTAPKPAPVPPPVPVPVPPPVPQPQPTPPPVPVPQGRRIASLDAHWLGVEAWSPKPDPHHFSIAFDFDRDTAGAGYRLHGDATPKDASGLPFYNEDIGRYPEIFAIDPTKIFRDATGKWSCGEGNNRVYYELMIDGVVSAPQGDMQPGSTWDQEVVDLSSETDEGGDTPVFVVPQDAPLDRDHHVAWRMTHVAADGTKTTSPWSKAAHIHAWGF